MTFLLTFPTVSDVMATEGAAKEEGIPGEVCPLPAELAAGCGLAFTFSGEEKETFLGILESRGIHWELCIPRE